ncbi:MAG: SRPBCC family protein [Pseudomonadota bacterium]
MLNKARFFALLCSLLPIAAMADIKSSSANGFAVQQKIAIKAPPATVWRMLVSHPGEWWNSDHTYSGQASNLSIEPRALGCFCERLGDSGVVVHMTVTFVNPGKMLRLTGGLGPLGLMGVDGNMTFSLSPGDTTTIVTLDYAVGGYSPDGLDTIAGAVDGVLGEQLARLRLFTETGSPTRAN